MTISRPLVLGTFLVVLAAAPAGAQPALPSEFFEAKIRPVLATKCYACHNRIEAPKGDLVLDTKAGVLKGGTLGPAIVPGKPAESKLLEALRYSNPHLQMPPSGKLADAIIADFERWIAAGAPDPRADTAAAGDRRRRVVGETELAKGRQWWAFQPVQCCRARSAHARRARTKTRSLRAREAAGETPDAFARSRRANADSPRVCRSDWPEADLRRGRGVRARHVAEQVRDARRPPARVAALRRALGALLARCGALRRRQSRATSRTRPIRMPGGTATGSSRASTRMFRTIAS